MPPPSFTGPTGGRVCPARYVNCPARRGGYHPPAFVGATCGRPSAGVPPGTRPMGPPRRPNGVVVVGRGGPAEGMSFRACPARKRTIRSLGRRRRPHFFPKKWGKRRAGGSAPWTPQTGARGGGGLYGQGKDQPRIAARFPGTYVTGAAVLRVARIGITPQALTAAALYRLGPPGRHRCHAAEIPRRLL